MTAIFFNDNNENKPLGKIIDGEHEYYVLPYPIIDGIEIEQNKVIDLTGFKITKYPTTSYCNMSFDELIDLYKKTLDENSKLTEQAERQLEIINKIHFLEQIYE